MKNVVCLLVIGLSFAAFGQYESPFNAKTIQTDSSGNYAFLVSGHFYGDRHNQSHFPANTLLANLDWINTSGGDFLVCLGDLFKDISKDMSHYETSFFNELHIPLVNTVGNHDLTGTVYEDHYGETFFSFELNGDIHLIIDTELSNGDIEGAQLDLIKSTEQKVATGNVNNVFIYTHRTVWKDAYPEMEGLFTDNTQSLTGNNFESEVLPLLNKMGEKSNVYWFSGSLGTAPASFFHFADTDHNVTIIATAIRSLPRDAALKVNVVNGKVNFEPQSFTGQDLLPLTDYNVDFWQNESPHEPYNWKLIPYYMQLTVTHRYFWYGVGSTLMGLFVIVWWRRRKKKRLLTK